MGAASFTIGRRGSSRRSRSPAATAGTPACSNPSRRPTPDPRRLGLSVLTEAEPRDLLEILEDRHQRASTIVTSQLPVDHRCDALGNPTLADTILDRLSE
jgi:hypothetical protein